jgi:hypothetical protein
MLPTPTDTFETFDPNKPDQTNVWGVYDARVFKTKSARPAALNTLMSCYRGKLYELVSGAWVLRAVKDPLDLSRDKCELCGCRIRAARSRWDQNTRSQVYDRDIINARWTWKREKGKITSPPELLALCDVCAAGYC